MNLKLNPRRRLWTVAGIPLIVLAGLLMFSGCQKDQPAAQQGGEASKVPSAIAAATTEQKTCPIMNNPINEALFVEYQGKKVYFCCKACPEQFLANPEKYMAKLPQFKN